MSPEHRVYVGTYTESIRFGTGELFQGRGEGIHLYRMDPASGELLPAGVAKGVKNPSYLCLDPTRRFLYAVNELKVHEEGEGGSVSAFSVNPSTGEPSLLNRQPTGGTDPCYVTTDNSGRHLMVANYSSGSVSVYPVLEDGSLAAASDFVQHEGSSVDPGRQNGPHAHSSVFDAANRFVHVCDLGTDRVVTYRFHADSGRLERKETESAQMKAGAGPRHLLFSADGRFAYVVNELDSTVTLCAHEEASGKLTPLESTSTLPADFRGENSCADLNMHPSGLFLYASNRGHDSIAIFGRDVASGRLTPVGYESTRGSTPRSFAIDPNGNILLVANQAGDNIVPFRIDTNSGRLQATGREVSIGTPVCVKIVEV